MSWNWRAIRAIIGKDLQQVRQNKMVWIPMVILPAILQVIMPVAMILLPHFVSPVELEIDDMASMIAMFPTDIIEGMETMTAAQQWVVLTATYMFAPLFLIVPLMVSSILGADSFVGEKERGTLEGLLYTPISDTELFIAKVLTALIPALLVSFGAFILYTVVVNISGYSIMGRVFFPSPEWWPLVLWLGPGCALVSLGTIVLISSKVSSFMQAQQTSGLLVLPVVGLMIGQISGIMFLGVGLTMILGLFAWLLGLWLIWIGAKTFSRGELMTRI